MKKWITECPFNVRFILHLSRDKLACAMKFEPNFYCLGDEILIAEHVLSRDEELKNVQLLSHRVRDEAY